jgi:hypothetical protein
MGFFFDELPHRPQRPQRTQPRRRIGLFDDEPVKPRPARLRPDTEPADPYVIDLFLDLQRWRRSERATWDKLMQYLITLDREAA